MNQTHFLIGQEISTTGDILQTILFQFYGPFCSKADVVPMRSLYSIDPAIKIDDINVCWDHACNVVVLQADYDTNSITFQTKQVSEYDAQVRPQPNYLVEPTGDCADCWRKVSGFGALDAGIWTSSGTAEWNCGDTCVFYTLEEHLKHGQVIAPRALVGRHYRTGTLSMNLTDSINVQTFSWNPYNVYLQNQFLGIGICCNEPWCHPDCKNLNSHLVLISFDPKNGQFSILSDIADTIDPDTIQMGVEFSTVSGNQKQAYVYYQHTVITFDLTDTNGYITAATKSYQSPKVDTPLVMWVPGTYIMPY